MCRKFDQSSYDSAILTPMGLENKTQFQKRGYHQQALFRNRSRLNKCSPLVFASCLSTPPREESLCSTLRRHKAWHAAIISSCTDASLPRQTQTVAGKKNTSHKSVIFAWVTVKHKLTNTILDHVIMSTSTCIAELGSFFVPFLIPMRYGLLLFFNASCSSPGL